MESLIRSLSKPLSIIPTNELSRMAPLPDIQAVLFDVYGTLLISGAGGTDADTITDAEALMVEALNEEGIVTSPSMALSKSMKRLIHQEHAKSEASGIAYPEVEIREIWKRILAESHFRLNDATLERVILRYECRANPCWPMPEAVETLATLRSLGLQLGILSNAQFYTQPLIEALLERSLVALGVRRDLVLWSFQAREAKPSAKLFTQLRDQLGEDGIAPEEVVFIGNDMRNDIAPAAAVGFKTALFAGDARSLRRREGEGLPIEPDVVLTSLDQLVTCIRPGAD